MAAKSTLVEIFWEMMSGTTGTQQMISALMETPHPFYRV
jgi:hypothetical protein